MWERNGVEGEERRKKEKYGERVRGEKDRERARERERERESARESARERARRCLHVNSYSDFFRISQSARARKQTAVPEISKQRRRETQQNTSGAALKPNTCLTK